MPFFPETPARNLPLPSAMRPMPFEFTDGRKRGSSCDDEQALVKAAAWAWHQHGSANDSKPTREFGLAKLPRQPRPSRYKLEAAAADDAAISDHLTAEESSEPPSLPGSPAGAEVSLLDPYEVERITRHLDLLIASTRDGGGGAVGGRRRRATPGRGKSTAKAGGFWLRHAVGLCGSGADVAEAGFLARRFGR